MTASALDLLRRCGPLLRVEYQRIGIEDEMDAISLGPVGRDYSRLN